MVQTDLFCRLLNNDQVLDCFEDDAKRERLFGRGDGSTLSREGEEAMLNFWLDSIRPVFESLKEGGGDSGELARRLEEVDVGAQVAPKSEEEEEEEEEFHEAENGEEGGDAARTEEKVDDDNGDSGPEDSSSSSQQTEFREKENEEKMEKELGTETKEGSQ